MNKQLELQNKLIELSHAMSDVEFGSEEYRELSRKIDALAMTRIVEYNMTHTDSYMYRDAWGGFTIVQDETKPYSNN